MGLADGVSLGHVGIEVSDLGRARRFYDKFLPVIGFRDLGLNWPGWLGYRKGATYLWITASHPRRTRRRLPRVPPGDTAEIISDHLGFKARSPSQVRAIERALRAKGLKPVYTTDSIDMGKGAKYVSCAFQDSDHNVMEVYVLTKRLF